MLHNYQNGYGKSTPFWEFPALVTQRENSGMDATTSRTLNIRLWVAEAGGPTDWSRRYSPLNADGSPRWPQPQVAQWISESSPKPIGGRLARDLEAAMRKPRGSMDAPPSQSAGLEIDRLGVALTAIDKALDDRVIQGRLGTLAEVLQFAYQRALKMNDPSDPHQRELFDDVVREHLRGWDGRERVAGTGAREDREVAAQTARTGRSAAQRGR
jgi:hypothetical protein